MESREDIFEVERVRPAYVQVAEQLKRAIVAGELVPDQRLPSEPDLCAAFGVSRSTIREALRMLSSQHFIVTTRGVKGGTFVAAPKPAQVQEYLETTFGLLAGTPDVSVGSLLEVRFVVESPAAALAAERRSDTDLRRMADALASDENHEKSFKRNWEFHACVADASQNVLLSALVRPLGNVIRSRFERESASVKFWTDIAEAHRRIFDAIEQQDAVRAELEMRTHLEGLNTHYHQIDRARKTDS